MDGYGVGGTNRCIARDKGSIGMAFFDVHFRLDWLRSFHPCSLAIASFSWALHLKRLPHVVFMIFFDSQLSFWMHISSARVIYFTFCILASSMIPIRTHLDQPHPPGRESQ